MRQITILLSLLIPISLLTYSCEPEKMVVPPPEEKITWLELTTEQQQKAYKNAAHELEMTHAYAVAGIREDLEERSFDDLGSLEFNQEHFAEELSFYVEKGWLSEADVTSLHSAMDFFRQTNWNGVTATATVGIEIDDFLLSEGINSVDHPLTFHTVGVIKDILVHNPITRFSKQSLSNEALKDDDGALCKTVGFLCPSLGPIENAAKSAAASAAASQLVKEVLGIASTALASAMSSAISSVLGTVWSSIFCRVECDACAGPAGILALYINCDLDEIQAIGTFEHAERWIFEIDANLDGTFDNTATNLVQNSAAATSLPNSHFKVIADVRCDDDELYPWAGPRNQPVSVWPDLNNSRPTGWLLGPPKQSGFIYPLNTQLCFTLNEIADGAWERAGWVANTGSPSSSSSNGNFCTTFTGSSRPAWVGARYINPCNTSQEKFISTSFVVQ